MILLYLEILSTNLSILLFFFFQFLIELCIHTKFLEEFNLSIIFVKLESKSITISGLYSL